MSAALIPSGSYGELLSGFVWDTPALYRALEIAAQVPGVRRVADQMELEREGTEGS